MKIGIRRKRLNLVQMVCRVALLLRLSLCFCFPGEPVVEPEVDLTSFLEKQRISDDVGPTFSLSPSRHDKDDEEDNVDASLAHISSNPAVAKMQSSSKKGKVQQIKWDEELDEINKEKKAAEATRGRFSYFSFRRLLPLIYIIFSDLKERFKAKSEKLRSKPPTSSVSRRKAGISPAFTEKSLFLRTLPLKRNYRKRLFYLCKKMCRRNQKQRWKKWKIFWMTFLVNSVVSDLDVGHVDVMEHLADRTQPTPCIHYQA